MDSQLALSWPWYIARASGLAAFLFLYLAVFSILSVRLAWMRRIVKPQYALPLHQWFAWQALVLSFFHMGALFFDHFMKLGLIDLLVPFASHFETNLVALGILGLYLMLLLVVVSEFRQKLPYRFWRTTHFLHVVLYLMACFHAYYLGTDFKNHPAFADVFTGLNQILFLLLVMNLAAQYSAHRKRKRLAGQMAARTEP
jgi:sulfoxide reductase heme-binding subunit YedZ